MRCCATFSDFTGDPAHPPRHDSAAVNFRDWGIPLGRRFRALKLWFVLRSYGADAIRAMIREHMALGHELAAWVDAEPEFERLAPAPLALVCLRHVPPALRDDEPALAHAQCRAHGPSQRQRHRCISPTRRWPASTPFA